MTTQLTGAAAAAPAPVELFASEEATPPAQPQVIEQTTEVVPSQFTMPGLVGAALRVSVKTADGGFETIERTVLLPPGYTPDMLQAALVGSEAIGAALRDHFAPEIAALREQATTAERKITSGQLSFLSDLMGRLDDSYRAAVCRMARVAADTPLERLTFVEARRMLDILNSDQQMVEVDAEVAREQARVAVRSGGRANGNGAGRTNGNGRAATTTTRDDDDRPPL